MDGFEKFILKVCKEVFGIEAKGVQTYALNNITTQVRIDFGTPEKTALAWGTINQYAKNCKINNGGDIDLPINSFLVGALKLTMDYPKIKYSSTKRKYKDRDKCK